MAFLGLYWQQRPKLNSLFRATIHESFALSILFGYYKRFLRSFKCSAFTDKPKSTRKYLFDIKYNKLSNSVIDNLWFLKSSLLHIHFAMHDNEILCNLPSNTSFWIIWSTRAQWLTNIFGRKISIVEIGGRISAKSFCFWNYSDPKVAFKRYLTAWWCIISCPG